jgi:hypothetical protein
VLNASGGTEKWELEAGSPSFLTRYGWKRDSVTIGDKVTVIVRPLLDGQRGGSISEVRLPDGRRIGGPDAPPPDWKPGDLAPTKQKRAEDQPLY